MALRSPLSLILNEHKRLKARLREDTDISAGRAPRQKRRRVATGKEVKAMARASRRWAAVAVAAVLLAGCAGGDDKSADERMPESEGFAWAGKGEQSNFGSDYNFCTRNTGGVGRSQATTRTVNDIAGNATNMSSTEAYGPGRQNATRGSYADKRGFWGCMESRGWQLVGGR
jgi:hypothetical protein